MSRAGNIADNLTNFDIRDETKDEVSAHTIT